jgi:hypothetical protein
VLHVFYFLLQFNNNATGFNAFVCTNYLYKQIVQSNYATYSVFLCWVRRGGLFFVWRFKRIDPSLTLTIHETRLFIIVCENNLHARFNYYKIGKKKRLILHLFFLA